MGKERKVHAPRTAVTGIDAIYSLCGHRLYNLNVKGVRTHYYNYSKASEEDRSKTPRLPIAEDPADVTCKSCLNCLVTKLTKRIKYG